jgi:phosphatidylglycerol:prolipoprotein diacylglycerol transferase
MLPRYILYKHLIINFYGLFFALGIISALLLLYYTAKFRDIKYDKLINFSILMVIIGFLGTRLFYVIFHWSQFQGRPFFNMIAFWRGGLMFQGGPILAVLCAPLLLSFFGLRFWATADVIAPSLALGQAIGRIGCFFAGCCYGQPTSTLNPLAVVFPQNSQAPAGVPLWPTQLMESVGLVFLFAFLLHILKKANKPNGLVCSIYLAGVGLLRFVVDFYRADNRGSLIFSVVPTTLMALFIFLLGLSLLITFLKKTRLSKIVL